MKVFILNDHTASGYTQGLKDFFGIFAHSSQIISSQSDDFSLDIDLDGDDCLAINSSQFSKVKSLLEEITKKEKKFTILLFPLSSSSHENSAWNELKTISPHIEAIFYDLNYFTKALSKTFCDIKEELHSLTKKLTNSLQLAKTEKRQKWPFRYGRYNNIELISSFEMGEGPGGEFVDTIENQNQTVILLTHGRSYDLNAHFLQYYTELKRHTFITLEQIEEFIFHFYQVYPKAVDQLQILMGILNHSEEELQGLNIGATKLFTPTSEILTTEKEGHTLPYFSVNLKTIPHLAIISSGFSRNGHTLTPSQIPFDKPRMDILDELFFELEKRKTTPSLRYDTTAILMGKMG